MLRSFANDSVLAHLGSSSSPTLLDAFTGIVFALYRFRRVLNNNLSFSSAIA